MGGGGVAAGKKVILTIPVTRNGFLCHLNLLFVV